jgi:DNA-binding CsgD family transcriptional regulator
VITTGKEAKLTERARGSRARGGRTPASAARSVGADDQRPVLIVNVDVVEADGPSARSCDVRLMRSLRDPAAQRPWGADGSEVTAVVILRDVTPSRVVSCVRAATRGGSISPELLGQLLPVDEQARADAGEPQLSDREYDVLRMLADGESTRGIAERLSYSERTVKNIVRDLLVKLNCKTRAHAVALAARQGVI